MRRVSPVNRLLRELSPGPARRYCDLSTSQHLPRYACRQTALRLFRPRPGIHPMFCWEWGFCDHAQYHDTSHLGFGALSLVPLVAARLPTSADAMGTAHLKFRRLESSSVLMRFRPPPCRSGTRPDYYEKPVSHFSLVANGTHLVGTPTAKGPSLKSVSARARP